ncbi:MAG: hypothetical protein KatS3mg015_2755 [Fimbriimonadales bacterium]|nr:MAG: hypothetical protein KatS3mg015_2755 [Fimbriimonadales bacterium]
MLNTEEVFVVERNDGGVDLACARCGVRFHSWEAWYLARQESRIGAFYPWIYTLEAEREALRHLANRHLRHDGSCPNFHEED